jgi:hypothetical protein
VALQQLPMALPELFVALQQLPMALPELFVALHQAFQHRFDAFKARRHLQELLTQQDSQQALAPFRMLLQHPYQVFHGADRDAHRNNCTSI